MRYVGHEVLLLLLAWLSCHVCLPGAAQTGPGTPSGPAPVMMHTPGTAALDNRLAVQIAQQSPKDTTTPIDLTPVRLPARGNIFDAFKAGALYNLPARMFFNASVENTIRLETNVFQTLKGNRADGIYRVLPNCTLGYALGRRTRVSANYFFLRDTYFRNHILNRNIHSVGFRVDQDFPINAKASGTVGFFARELFITDQPELNDLIPSVVIVRRAGSKGIIYGSVLGQVRFRKVLGRYQEFDQFYSIGGVYRSRPWVFTGDLTFISNFGKRALRFGPNNYNFILTLEAGRQIVSQLPMTAFVRVEPIFNIGANQAQGFAGVNVRVFGGIRAEISKPAIFPIKFGRS